MRINKYIASAGVSSRRKAEELIKQGKVFLNGKKVTDLATNIDVSKDKVCVDNKIIRLDEDKIYIVLNKPKGYVTTSKEQFSRKCIMDLINENHRLFSVGRLDMDTEGLIILTNDGKFANELMHPRNKVYKTYLVKTDSNVSNEEIETLKKGVDIGGYVTKEAKVIKIKEKLIEISISEGKNRQVRKMFNAINKNVVNLKRIAIGNLKLENIAIGKYKKYTLKEIKNKIYNK